MTRTALLLVALSAALLAFGCDSSSDPAPAGGDSTQWMIHATLDPEAPEVAQHTLHIHLMDADGEGVPGATVTVDPQMPSMGHGSNEDAVVTEMSGGMYEAFPVTFTMPGTWEVTVTCSLDGHTASETFTYDVE
jgi:hypothetical protein